VGCTNKLRLTTWQAIVDFLPSGGTARALPSGTLVNPGTSYSNVLAGQLVAATLNVKFDSADVRFGSSNQWVGNLVIVSGPFIGWTVNQLIAEANRALGGCGSVYSFSALTTALDLFNNNYEYSYMQGSQYVNRCYLGCPVSGSGGLYKFMEEDVATVTDLQFTLFPNPVSEHVSVIFESAYEGVASIHLYTIEGHHVGVMMERSVLSGDVIEADVSTALLPAGVYLVRLSIDSHHIVKRVVR
jgi:hypothetical protein